MPDIWETATKIVWVDADACPKHALLICRDLASRFKWQVVTVSNFHHDIDSPHHVMVGGESQATDLAILNRLRKSDLVITADQGLAALVLARGAFAMSVNGHVYQESEMQSLLEFRHALAQIRKSGGRTKGPRKRTMEDNQNFQQSLESFLTGQPIGN